MKRVLYEIIPAVSLYRANRALTEKINSEESQANVAYLDNINAIPIDSFRQKYAESFEMKNRFEDKAKTNVFGITIAISVIMGATGLTGSLINKYHSPILNWIVFFILLAAIVYLLASGIDAIKVLFKENTMSTVALSDLSTDSFATKEKYDDCINRNIYRNTIRNNYLHSSFLCIRNSLICLMVLFILVSVPITAKNSISTTAVVATPFSDSSVSYSSTVIIPDGLVVAKINESIFQDLAERDVIEENTVYSFVNIAEKYFVQYRCYKSDIIVTAFSCFDRVHNEGQ